MTVNDKNVISWFENRKGKLTYSMYGSRNGADGTADCSGSITQAIFEAGAAKYAYLYSTVTLASYLQENGYTCISRNQDWEAEGGEIVLMSWGQDMSTSGGAGGHVGGMKDANTFISVDYWTGGEVGTAVSEHNWNEYYSSNKPTYVEVWRNNQSSGNTASTGSDSNNTNYQKGEIEMYLIFAIDTENWYVSNGVQCKWVKTERMLKNYQNEIGKLNLRVDKMYSTELYKEFPKNTIIK